MSVYMTPIHVMRCVDCDEAAGEKTVMPFPSPEARGRWAAEHTLGTGHNRWADVVDLTQRAQPW